MGVLQDAYRWITGEGKPAEKIQFNDLQRTANLANKNYIQRFPGPQFRTGKIYSEGCWEMRIYNMSSTTGNILLLIFEGNEVFPLEATTTQFDLPLIIPGQMEICQANIIQFSWQNPPQDDDYFIVRRSKIVPKEDSIIYPPESPNLRGHE